MKSNLFFILALLTFVAAKKANLKTKIKRNLGEDCDLVHWCDSGLHCKDYRCTNDPNAADDQVPWGTEKCDWVHPCQGENTECQAHRCVVKLTHS
jgi:hypothetical protein